MILGQAAIFAALIYTVLAVLWVRPADRDNSFRRTSAPVGRAIRPSIEGNET